MKNQTYRYNGAVELENGENLKGLLINYSTLGELNEAKDNVIWVCHALTANADAQVWWDGLIGAGKFYDPKKYFIICANILGSCYGSTGPLDIDPETSKPYYYKFPAITIRDMVKAHEILRAQLHIEKIHTCIGGSLGGQQALEWAISKPELISNLVLLATNAFHSPWGIAFNESQRMAIMADNTWTEESPNAGREGLKAARAIALLSYRTYHTYLHSQAEKDLDKTDNFKASSYQNYQGEKLVNRFNCHSYWYLTKAMDSHNVGRDRGGVEKALKRVKARALMIGIKTDLLFPPAEQKYISENIEYAEYHEIESLFGHDGFLIETDNIARIIENFYKSPKENSAAN